MKTINMMATIISAMMMLFFYVSTHPDKTNHIIFWGMTMLLCAVTVIYLEIKERKDK